MIRSSFNAGWVVGPKVSGFAALAGGAPTPQPVTLPHDAIRDLPRSADSARVRTPATSRAAHFSYSKTFDVPAGVPRQGRHDRVRGRLPRRDGLSSTASSPPSDRTAMPASPSRRTRTCATGSPTRSPSRRAPTRTAAGTPAPGSTATCTSSCPTRSTWRSTASASPPPTSTPSARSSPSPPPWQNETARHPHGAGRDRDPGPARRRRRERLRARDAAARHDRGQPRAAAVHRPRRCGAPTRPRSTRCVPPCCRTETSPRRGTQPVRHPPAAARSATRPAHQRPAGRPARRLHPPRQRPARRRDDRAR